MATVSALITLSNDELQLLSSVPGLSESDQKILAQTRNLGGIEFIPLKVLKSHYSESLNRFWKAPDNGYTWVLTFLLILGIAILIGVKLYTKYPGIWEKFRKPRQKLPQGVLHRSKAQPELVQIVAIRDAVSLPPEQHSSSSFPISNPPSPMSAPTMML